VISKMLDNRRFVVDGFASGGNSGSPVFVRLERRGAALVQIEFRLVGLVSEHLETSIGQKQTFSGLCVVESVDHIVEVLSEFEPSSLEANEFPFREKPGEAGGAPPSVD
jgi:hypothetical protein